MNTNLQSKDIDAALSHGQIFSSKGWRTFFIVMYAVLGFAFALFLVIIIASLILGDYDDIWAMAGCGGLALFVTLSIVMINLFTYSGVKKANIWLQDAVILQAKAISLGERVLIRGLAARNAAAIRVEFEYNGEKRVKQSEVKGKIYYLPVYLKYINKKITIAYSPKYDEIMFIKPESVKNIQTTEKD